MPCSLPDGVIGQSGPALVPASRFPQPESSVAPQTSAISGPSSSASSRSAALQLSLENRLRAALDVNGSLEYALTWKHWDMVSGAPILALRASGRRTSDNGFTGWLNGWTTPQAHDVTPRSKGQNAKHGTKHGCADLNADAHQIAGWATTTTRDWKDGDCSKANVPINSLLGRQVHLSHAQTEKRGALNPAFSLWLMGFPTAWASCGARVTRSSRKSRRSSSPLT